MLPTMADHLTQIERDGYAVLHGVFARDNVDAILQALQDAFTKNTNSVSIRSESDSVYAARNILSLWPESATVWRQQPLPQVLQEVLGPQFGLVRVLYFDKPPDRTWALPWHKDLTIAVREHHRGSRTFTKPTTKAGVPHAEAPEEVLAAMLTARIHLDDVTEENGPLKVIPGSHRAGKRLHLGDTPPVSIQVAAGDVLLIRPLLAHSSGRSHPDTRRHRRILHLEFAASPELADGFAWHCFVAGRE
jgi:ectoine hydroxylase-related dioxygenase (phytanoyl-CoA dioxygenase family)